MPADDQVPSRLGEVRQLDSGAAFIVLVDGLDISATLSEEHVVAENQCGGVGPDEFLGDSGDPDHHDAAGSVRRNPAALRSDKDQHYADSLTALYK